MPRIPTIAEGAKQQRISDGNRNATVSGVPSECPRCHHGVEPVVRYLEYFALDGISFVEALMRCPRTACAEFFLVVYEQSPYNGLFEPVVMEPISIKRKQFFTEIEELSRQFCEIYN
jgi:hypothetical protein